MDLQGFEKLKSNQEVFIMKVLHKKELQNFPFAVVVKNNRSLSLFGF